MRIGDKRKVLHEYIKKAFVGNGWQISVIDSRKKVKLCKDPRGVIIGKNEKFGVSPIF
jgi:hypothetical protein